MQAARGREMIDIPEHQGPKAASVNFPRLFWGVIVSQAPRLGIPENPSQIPNGAKSPHFEVLRPYTMEH